MAEVAVDKKALIEGERPVFKASYGKLMMWFFLVSDAFTFSALLITYGALRISNVTEGYAWSNPENVFTHMPILYEVFHVEAPLAFVGLMTFVLIISSVTMVLAVEAGHRKSRKEVAKYVLLTIFGGATFLGCQAYEWYHFILGTKDGAHIAEVSQLDGLGSRKIPGLEDLVMVQMMPTLGDDGHEVTALEVRDGATITNENHIEKILDEASHQHAGTYMISKKEAQLLNIPALTSGTDVVVAYPVRQANPDIKETKRKKVREYRLNNGYPIREPMVVRAIDNNVLEVDEEDRTQMSTAQLASLEESEKWNLTDGGANLKANEYGPPDFAGLFFFVTGFHGTHVFSGVVLLVILYLNVVKGTYDRRGHYEMTEKIGLYWHFVDLVWVFVFTFFYLV
jgi:cytochrome c oxidase subunit 3